MESIKRSVKIHGIFYSKFWDRAVSGGGDASVPNLDLQEKHIQPEKQPGPVGMIEERKMYQRRKVGFCGPIYRFRVS